MGLNSQKYQAVHKYPITPQHYGHGMIHDHIYPKHHSSSSSSLPSGEERGENFYSISFKSQAPRIHPFPPTSWYPNDIVQEAVSVKDPHKLSISFSDRVGRECGVPLMNSKVWDEKPDFKPPFGLPRMSIRYPNRQPKTADDFRNSLTDDDFFDNVSVMK